MQRLTMMRDLRRAQDLTQQQLGERCGVSQALVAQVETGRVTAYPSIKKRIAEALGVKIKDIWGPDGS
jgi:transcriptional regulator with XRE-family HTH domain